MSKTLSDLQTGVRLLLDEATQADFLDTEVTASINYKYMDVVGEIMQIYEDYYETITPVSIALVANQQEYSLDSSLLKIDRAEINYNPTQANSKAVRAIRAKPEEIWTTLANTPITGGNFNCAYYVRGAQDVQIIGFVPAPIVSDTGSTKSISIWGIQQPSLLVNSTDTAKIPFPDRFGEIIEYGATAKLLSKGQQDEGASSKYQQIYDIKIQTMKAYLKERLSDGPDMIVDVELKDMDFETIQPYS